MVDRGRGEVVAFLNQLKPPSPILPVVDHPAEPPAMAVRPYESGSVTALPGLHSVAIERLPARRISGNEPRESMNCKSCRKRKVRCLELAVRESHIGVEEGHRG